MHMLGSRNTFEYSHDFNMMVDFCIWVLEVDGLQVTPFDQHPDGDGSLRAIGLDAVGWQSWLIRIVDLQYQQRQANMKILLEMEDSFITQKRDPLSLFVSEVRNIPKIYNPPMAWNGNAPVGTRLAELWEQYGPIFNERSKWEMKQSRAWQKEEAKAGKRLYDELQPYYSLLPMMNIYFVSYPQPINYLILPVSVVMTATEGQLDAAAFRNRVLDAAAGLTFNKSRVRQKQNSYTFSPFSSPNVPKPMYKLYPRKAVQIMTPRPQVYIIAENEAKQVILDALSDDEHSYFGEINMETVQFLREKIIPGWQMHYVDFEEIDGEKQHSIWILEQASNGSWIVKSASTGGNLREGVENLVAQVHDHPLLFLSGGTSTGYTKEGTYQHEFVAHGEIIDNGFDVTRVRLVNDASQVYEDSVQDGLILFAGTQEREVQLPMKAELYNAKGKLVWRQTVLDNRPPLWWKFKAP